MITVSIPLSCLAMTTSWRCVRFLDLVFACDEEEINRFGVAMLAFSTLRPKTSQLLPNQIS